MERIDEKGVGVKWENMKMGGYKMRINVVCERI